MITQSRRVLVLGGARSGKSAFAERLASLLGQPVVYVATAWIADEEMAERVREHQSHRPADWVTVEAAEQLGSALRAQTTAAGAVLVDSVTLLVSAAMEHGRGAALPTNATDKLTTGDVGKPGFGRTAVPQADLPAALAISADAAALGERARRQRAAERRVDETASAVRRELEALWDFADERGAALVLVSDEVGMGLVPERQSGRRFRDLLGGANAWLASRCDAVYLLVAGLAIDVKALAVPWPVADEPRPLDQRT